MGSIYNERFYKEPLQAFPNGLEVEMIKWLRRTHESIYANPLYTGRHPFQVYLMVLCVLSSLPQLFGFVTAGSIESELPDWLAAAWNSVLLVGSTITLLGSYWPKGIATALTLERAGLALVGSASLVYTAVIIFDSGWTRLLAAAIIAAFGLSCLRRSRDIGHVITTAIKVAKEA